MLCVGRRHVTPPERCSQKIKRLCGSSFTRNVLGGLPFLQYLNRLTVLFIIRGHLLKNRKQGTENCSMGVSPKQTYKLETRNS